MFSFLFDNIAFIIVYLVALLIVIALPQRSTVSEWIKSVLCLVLTLALIGVLNARTESDPLGRAWEKTKYAATEAATWVDFQMHWNDPAWRAAHHVNSVETYSQWRERMVAEGRISQPTTDQELAWEDMPAIDPSDPSESHGGLSPEQVLRQRMANPPAPVSQTTGSAGHSDRVSVNDQDEKRSGGLHLIRVILSLIIAGYGYWLMGYYYFPLLIGGKRTPLRDDTLPNGVTYLDTTKHMYGAVSWFLTCATLITMMWLPIWFVPIGVALLIACVRLGGFYELSGNTQMVMTVFNIAVAPFEKSFSSRQLHEDGDLAKPLTNFGERWMKHSKKLINNRHFLNPGGNLTWLPSWAFFVDARTSQFEPLNIDERPMAEFVPTEHGKGTKVRVKYRGNLTLGLNPHNYAWLSVEEMKSIKQIAFGLIDARWAGVLTRLTSTQALDKVNLPTFHDEHKMPGFADPKEEANKLKPDLTAEELEKIQDEADEKERNKPLGPDPAYYRKWIRELHNSLMARIGAGLESLEAQDVNAESGFEDAQLAAAKKEYELTAAQKDVEIARLKGQARGEEVASTFTTVEERTGLPKSDAVRETISLIAASRSQHTVAPGAVNVNVVGNAAPTPDQNKDQKAD